MDRQELATVLDGLRREHEAVAAELTVLQRRESSLAQAISGLEGLTAETRQPSEQTGAPTQSVDQVPSPAHYPRGADAVREVLKTTRRAMTVREITEELLQRGWAPRSKNPENATSSNAARAAEVMADVVRRRDEKGRLVYLYGHVHRIDSAEHLHTVDSTNLAGVDDGPPSLTGQVNPPERTSSSSEEVVS